MSKRKIVPGLILALLLGAAGGWALLFGRGSFPAFNRYYQLDDYLQEFEQALAQNLPFADELDRKSTRLNSSHRIQSRMPSSA